MQQIGFVIDPIASLHPQKDSTIAMMMAAAKRDMIIWVMQVSDLYVAESGDVCAQMFPVTVREDVEAWYTLGEPVDQPLSTIDVVMMRKDPPFDMDYIFATYLLELAEQQGAKGAKVVNRPGSIRDANEKFFISYFPQCIVPMVISSQEHVIRQFLQQHADIIVKPLDGMGGASIFRLRQDDPNIGVVLESMTHFGQRHIMAQRYLPEVAQGDKRILMIAGQPVDYALARIPAQGETRANLAAGGTGKAVPLTERDRWLCAQIAPTLIEKGLTFVGVDVIGDYITEINVTSPTCIREIDAQCGTDIAGKLLASI